MRHELCPAGLEVDAWLTKHHRTRAWLAEELRVDRVVLWRWMMGLTTPRLDSAADIKRICGVDMGAWVRRRTGTDG